MSRCRGAHLVRTSRPRGCGKTRCALGTFSVSGLLFFWLRSPANQTRDPGLIQRAANVRALPRNWKAALLRARTDQVP